MSRLFDRRYIPGLKPRINRKPGENYLRYPTSESELRIHVHGLGDRMMMRQFGRAFHRYVESRGEPSLGTVQLAVGGFSPLLDMDDTTPLVYWWYSFGSKDDQPLKFLTDIIEPRLGNPDLILCASEAIEELATSAGYRTESFPLGVFDFRPLRLPRSGLGFAGSKEHKSGDKIKNFLNPFAERDDFEWVDDLLTVQQLNLWYNTKEAIFGMHKEGQRQLGTVNSRVFESLAAATPIILYEHHNLNNVLGFEYPYQVSSSQEAQRVLEALLSDEQATRAEFQQYSEKVIENHSYLNRIETFVNALRAL